MVEWQLLASLAEEDRRTLLALTRRRRFKRNEVVFHDGDPGDSLHLISKGRVAVRVMTPLGDTATLVILGPGEYFGEMAILSPAPRNATVVALEPLETLTLHREDFNELRRQHRWIDTFLIEALASELRRSSLRLLEALYVSVDKRVLRRLAALVDIYQDSEADTPVVIPLTQEDIAQLAGTTRPTANRVIRAAEAAGMVRLGRGKVEIVDADGLRKRAR